MTFLFYLTSCTTVLPHCSVLLHFGWPFYCLHHTQGCRLVLSYGLGLKQIILERDLCTKVKSIFIFVLFFMLSVFLWLLQSIQLENSVSFAEVELNKWFDDVVIKGTLFFCLSNAAWVLELFVFLFFLISHLSSPDPFTCGPAVCHSATLVRQSSYRHYHREHFLVFFGMGEARGSGWTNMTYQIPMRIKIVWRCYHCNRGWS